MRSAVPPLVDFHIDGAQRRRTQMILLAAILLAILLHLAVGILMSTHLAWLAALPKAQQTQQAAVKTLNYVTLPIEAEPEVVKPEEALAEAKVSRLARQPDPVVSKNRSAPSTRNESKALFSALEGSRMAPPNPAGTPTRPSTPTPPTPKPKQQQRMSRPRETSRTMPQPTSANGILPTLLKPPQPKRSPAVQQQTPTQRPTPPRPPTRRIGTQGGDGGKKLPKMTQSSGIRAGVRSIAVLGSKYPKFMEEMMNRFHRAIAFEQQTNPLTYRQAFVVMTFRVNEEGLIYDIEFIESHPAELITEPAIARRVIKTVLSWGPLPKPTPAMLADDDFKTITATFNFVP